VLARSAPGAALCSKSKAIVKRIFVIFAALFIMVATFSALIVPAPTWKSLFNSKDLSGWQINGQEKWIVEDGTILCESAANKYGYLATLKSYRNFDLRLKFKAEAGGNSGVFLRAKITGIDPEHGPDIEGMQVEVDANVGKHTGGLYESGGRGWVAMPAEAGERALKPGTWNDLEVSAQGNHIVTQLNGLKIVDLTDPAQKFNEGVVGLQIHTGGGVKMRWKDIYIREE
jgi:3-keto-disaccharide hydrolase